ncbi:hypothetical protein T09_8696 [Trichinella sp. T9]|nr:hypothetical protein T09_8696 [Trichinella sp. T9]
MDYVNMREFPSSRSRCHSQIAFPTGSVFPCQTMESGILFLIGMDYVNMREFPSSRSRCHSQIAFPTGSVFPCQTMCTTIFTAIQYLERVKGKGILFK